MVAFAVAFVFTFMSTACNKKIPPFGFDVLYSWVDLLDFASLDTRFRLLVWVHLHCWRFGRIVSYCKVMKEQAGR